MTKEEIREYILDTADLYGITDCVVDALGRHDDNAADWNETVETVSTLLGLSVESICSCDQVAARRLYEKYPYFDMLPLWDFSVSTRKPGKAEALMEYLFTFDQYEDPDYYPKNKFAEIVTASVLYRCGEKIKGINKLFPGTFPDDVPISSFHIETDYFTDYADIYNLIYEKDRVVNRFSELFFKALNTELEEDEIHEFNLYCTHFDARDMLVPSIYIFYSYVEENRELFLSEGFTRFEDYISLKLDFVPWKAREFYKDPQYVENYIHQHPFSKKEIRKFINDVSAYHCYYVYKGDKETQDSSLDGVDPFACDEPYEFSDEILIEKTEDELGEDKELIERIKKMVISSKLGGVDATPDYLPIVNERVSRVKTRLERGWIHD